MPDRLAEIRARLDAANLPTYTGWDPAWNSRAFEGKHDFIAHAPADIAWLLDEVERLTPEKNPVTKVGWIPNEHRTGP